MKETILPSASKKNFTWIDLTSPGEDELLQIAEEYNLHRYTVKDSLQPDHLPKIELFENVTFIITRFYFPKPGKTTSIQEITSKLAIFYSASFIITIHRVELPFLTELKKTFQSKAEIKTPANMVTRLLWHVINTYDKPSDEVIRDLDSYETRIFLKELIPGLHQSLYYLKRKAETSRRMLSLTETVINVAHQGEPNNPFLQDLRDLHVKLINKYDQALSNINNLLNIYISLSAQKTNEAVKVLTIFSAFFMPLTFIVGVYGMNFAFMPELKQPWAYPALWIVMLAVSVIIFVWFRRKKWL